MKRDLGASPALAEAESVSHFDPERLREAARDLIARFGQDDLYGHLHTMLEAADEIDAMSVEMARRDRNEHRNCINWGPCSRNDSGMSEKEWLARQASPSTNQ